MSDFNTRNVDDLMAADEAQTCEGCTFFREMMCPEDNWKTRAPTETACVCFEEE